MKAISLWQPWATAIALRLKQIETRGWYTTHRGPLAIQAALTQNDEIRRFWDSTVCDPIRKRGYPYFTDLPRGFIVCTCILTECLRSNDVADLTPQERSFGNYGIGRFAWILRDIKPCDQPIRYRGMQGMFNCDCRVESDL